MPVSKESCNLKDKPLEDFAKVYYRAQTPHIDPILDPVRTLKNKTQLKSERTLSNTTGGTVKMNTISV